MKNKVIYIAVIAVNLITQVSAKPPENLSCAKQAIINYYQSNEFEKDVNAIVGKAEKYLLRRVTSNSLSLHPQKLAMVMDIDDTVLSNFPNYKKRDFSGLPDQIDSSFQDVTAPAIPAALHLYNLAIKNNVAVFFITFRPAWTKSYTMANLQNAGYYGWKAIYLPNKKEIKLPPQIYKTHIRQRLSEQGYDIILSVGDQDSDLVGGYADYLLKIPNPLYKNCIADCQKNANR